MITYDFPKIQGDMRAAEEVIKENDGGIHVGSINGIDLGFDYSFGIGP